ncbi:hypothetical protein SODALDRAFT_315593 [Sodiomyces alkalinus F11]|uniref:RING-type domain-containing protein n=1 Tax=Sodiomyces alkalinus (strain CBS 110278 / VKM F-3762 / F11) TaxID=1314773 RepID=A0A3N2PQ85_SODAK|nr:hypothetical protein SODALDRAFT_315593 [Sodiomyces alkalinus F11]ROT36590.1 hypothetical protein SODALDRAFT_315593 [Sodiomyces alkalinus F11]
MSTQYEVEHNISPSTRQRENTRRVDMSTFDSFLRQILTTDPSSSSSTSQHHHNPHATPTPVAAASLFTLLQEQFQTLHATAPSPANASFLESLVSALEADIERPPTEIPGVNQEYLDSLDRVDRKRLGADEQCPICAERFLDDKYCLVVELPCHHSHRFDLECVSPWLLGKGSCPMCRKDLTKKKEPPVLQHDDDEEDDDPDGLYA